MTKEQVVFGQIEEGKLKGKKMIVSPRKDLPDNLYLVEVGTFFNGAPMYALFCLNKGCEKQIPSGYGCPKCNAENHPKPN